jgi:hypothetical protein
MRRLLFLLICAVTLLAMKTRAQNVVTDWNTIASTTIVANGGKASVASGVWFAYMSIAVYDAVNAVHGHKFQPFYYSGVGPRSASDEAAAAAAAHRVLVNYFPAQQQNLDAQFNASLSRIAARQEVKAQGVAVGEAAALVLLCYKCICARVEVQYVALI